MSKGFAYPIYVTRPLLPDLNRLQAKMAEIWESKWLTNCGSQHARLEERLTGYLGVPCLSLFNNGTIALLTACQALGLSGEVITTPFTFAATPHVLAWSNIRPVFCDIDPHSLNIDPARIEPLITRRTSAIMPVHVFGHPCDVDSIRDIADKHRLKVVYDAAHACGVGLNGVGIGNFGDVTMFSFHATKLFHTVEGGALACKDGCLKENFELLKNFGIQDEDTVLLPGINGKMNEVQAAIGLLVLDELAAEQARRKRLIETYANCLRPVEGVSFYRDPIGVDYNGQYFVVRISEKEFGCSRDQVYEKLKEYNVFARKYFHPLCSDFPSYRRLPSANHANLPVAAQVAREVLSLPLFGELTTAQVEKICSILASFRRPLKAYPPASQGSCGKGAADSGPDAGKLISNL